MSLEFAEDEPHTGKGLWTVYLGPMMHFIRSLLSGKNDFFVEVFGLLLFAAYFPAFIAWFFSNAILLGLHRMIFGEPGPNGYKSVVAQKLGYGAIIASVLIGATVAILETVAVIAAISGKPLYR